MKLQKITVGQYLLNRLAELGARHIFGVPGDYNLGFLDQIENHSKLKWVGNCNELNAAYAADGYARVKGIAAVVTTFGVGELSAINGIAGAFAEYVPVVNIVGMPSLSTQKEHALVHHTLGTGDFHVFANMFSKVTTSHTVLNQFNPAREIDRVLEECWIRKRPVYIGIPSDITSFEIEVEEKPLELDYPDSVPDAITEAVERTAKLIEQAKQPVFLADICAIRHPMKNMIEKLINITNIPIATMNMGKGIINESHPNFLGMYNGNFSTEGVQDVVENSDCLVSFGTVLSDFNTGGFSCKLNASVTIEVHSSYVKVKHSVYENLYFKDFIPALIKRLENYKHPQDIRKPATQKKESNDKTKAITHENFWKCMSDFYPKNSIIMGETGTSMFGTLASAIPEGAIYIAQPLWASIGYTVGALLGAALAAPDRQAILFIGDGSFQLTAQEVSTMLRQKLTPIIFLLNNDGYTIERVIHGPTMEYNDIQMWNYAELPKIFDNKHVWSIKVKDQGELDKALQELNDHKDKMRFIEVMMDRNDAPAALVKIGEACAEANKY